MPVESPKRWSVRFTFPDLPASKAEQTTVAHAGNPGLAIKRAFDDVRVRPGIKGRRISRLSVTVLFLGVDE